MCMLKIFFIDRSLYLIESVPCSRKKESTIRNKNRWIYIYIRWFWSSINMLQYQHTVRLGKLALSVDLSAFFVQGGRVIVFLRRVGRGTSALRLIFARSTPRRSTGMAHRGKLLRCLHDKSGERAVGTWYPVDRSRCSDSLLSRGHTSVVPLPHTRARARTSRTLARHSAIIFHPVSVQFLNRLMLSNATDRASFAGIEVGEISFEPFFFFIINEDTIEEQVVSE